MKILSVIIAVLAASTVQAAAGEKWCSRPGQPCYMLKRAADATGEVRRSAEALADAMADAAPDALQKWCSRPGQPCYKVKRAAEAVDEVRRSADTLADAFAAIDEE